MEIPDVAMAVIGEWFTHHHGYPVADVTMDDLRRRLALVDSDDDDDEVEFVAIGQRLDVRGRR